MECASGPGVIAARLPAASFAGRGRGGADRSHRAVLSLRGQLRSLGRHALGSVLAGLAVLAIGAPEQANAQTPNTPATGAPTISGTLHVGRTQTASPGTIDDDDGLTNASYSYQWILVDGTDEEDISGATGAIYILNAAAVGKKIKVRASFTDDAGNAESRTSAPTATVEYGAPPTLGVVAGVGQGVLWWTHTVAGLVVTHNEYRSSPGAVIAPNAMWQRVQTRSGGPSSYYQVVKGLTSDTTHTFQVRAAADDTKGASATVTATPLSQPSCTIDELGDRRLLWQGQLTAGVREISTDGNIETGYGGGGIETGTLTPAAVTFRSTSYSVYPRTYEDFLNIVLREEDSNTWYPRDEVVDALRLHVCNTPYDFSSAATPGVLDEFSGYQWNVGSIWPPGIERTLRLSLPANNAATGEPAISGTAQAGQDLTADASPIMDIDGLTGVDFTYKWFRVDADGTSNEAEISGETAATYTLAAADAGKKVKVQVSFTDELSGEEMRTSAAYPSSGTVTTAASTTAPALTSVTVTSTPHKTTDTYGAREHIEFSMSFDAPVTVTGDPTFAFDLGGASTASYYAGSGTATLRFSHAVTGGTSGDRDTNGISWAENAIALNGGTIAGTDNAVAAVLTHAAQSNLAGHKVDGRTTAVTPATVTDVVVTSTPMLMASGSSTADTYGFGETIVITVTVSEAVEVEGDPVFRFSLTNPGSAANNPQATYDRTRSIATTIVFTYTVQAGDMDNNGIWIGTHSQTFSLDANDRIRTASQQIDIDRSHLEKGTQGGHKVDGSLGAPTVPPDPTAPTLVSATATTLTIEWTHPGDGGSPLTRNYVHYRVEGATDWTNWYAGETPVTRAVITNLAAATAYDVRVHATNAIGNSSWTQSATAFSTLGNTAPTAADNTVTTGEDRAYAFTADDFEFDDDDAGDTLASVKIVTPPAAGTLALDGTAVLADGVVTKAQIDGDMLTFRPARDAHGAPYTTFTFKVNDGTDDSADAYTMTIDVTDALAPVCAAPSFGGRREIWSGTVTVEQGENVGLAYYGFDEVLSNGTLLPSQSFFTGSNNYVIDALLVRVNGALEISFTGNVILTLGELNALRMHVCDGDYDFSTSSESENTTIWLTTLDWSPPVVTRTVYLSLPGNNAATGEPAITGTAQVGQELTADASPIMDTDGLTDVDFRYQWLRVDADGTSNEEDISGEIVATYTLTNDDVGKRIKVKVSFTDDLGSDEQRTSAPTDTVTAVAMTTPGVTVSKTALTVTEEDTTGDSYTVVLDSQPTATVTVTVAGHAGTDVSLTPSSATLTFTPTNWGTAQTVTVTAGPDADMANESVSLTHSAASTDSDYEGITIAGVEVTVTDNDAANTPATGAPTITGTAQVGQTLTAVTTGIMDDDGLTSPTYTYQWIRVDGTDEADIASANSSTYTLGDADLGTTLKVKVTFADDLGHTETLTSAATATVGAAATGPPTVTDVAVTSTPASGTTYYLAGEVIEFTVTFSAPVTVTATPKFAFRLGAATRQAAYASGSDSAALVFARTVQAGEVDRNGISWNAIALALDGGTITQTGATTAARLTHAEQAPLEEHRVDAAPPMQVSASVQGLALVLVYDEPLDPASMPATGAYTVTATVGATTTNLEVSEVSIYGIWVTLTLDAAPAAGATVTLAYAPPASNPVQDEAGNDAPAFSGQSVRLGPPPPPPPPDLAQVMGVGVAPGNAQLVVTWTVVDTATGYTVQWKSGGQGYNAGDRQATVTSGTTTSHTITGLANGTEYTVQVSATRTGATDGPPSDEMTGTPTVPTAAGITVSTAALTVTEQDSTGDGYTVVLDTEPTADVVVTVAGHVGTDVTANPTTLTFTMSNWETAQTVTVTADDDADTTDDSVALTHSAASADSGYSGITIAGVAVTVNDNDTAQVLGVGVAPGNAQLVVTWTAVDTATGYTVQWTSGGQGYNTTNRQATVTSGTTTSHTITGLANGTEYTVQVSATRTGANDGPPSDEMTGTPFTTPPPPPVTDLAQVMGVGVAPGNAQLVVTWTAVDTATGYTVQWMSGSQGYNAGDRQATVTSGSTTRYTIPSLTNGTAYTVRVIATRTGVTDGPPSAEMTGTPFTTPPPPPVTDLAQVMGVGVAPGNAQLVVTWTAVDTATGYTVQWTSGSQDYNTGDRQATVTSGSTTRYTIPSLTNGTAYTVRVIATRTGATDGPPSAEMTGTPRVPPPPPPPVTDLAQVMGVGVAPGNAQLVVTWTTVDTATGYTVQWTSGSQGYNTGDRQATVTSGSTTRYTIPSLTNGTAYTVRVIATRTGATDGPPSAEMTGTPRVPPPPPPPPPRPNLAQVMGVGVAPGNAQLVVTWTAVDTATGYTVQWTSGSQGYNTGDRQATVTSGSTTRYTIPSLTNGTAYTVRVIATRTGATDGPPSAEMTGTPRVPPPPPPPVTDLAQVMGVGVAPGNAQLVVTWTAVDTATGYTVQWMSGSQGYNTGDRQAPVTSGSTTRYTIPSLTNGTAYTVRVIATRTGVTDGPPSAEVTATPVTTPAAPQHLRGEPGDAQVTLRWAAPASDGGSPILRYEYAIDDSGTWIDAGGDLEETVPGLTNGQSYAVAVRAVNAAGAGPATTVTASPVTTPGAPQRLRSEPGDAQVTLTLGCPDERRRVPDPPVRVCGRRQRDLDRRGRRPGGNSAGPDERAVVRRRGAGGERGRCRSGDDGDECARRSAAAGVAGAIRTHRHGPCRGCGVQPLARRAAGVAPDPRRAAGRGPVGMDRARWPGRAGHGSRPG